jgi:fatty-acyl-CoA synthase
MVYRPSDAAPRFHAWSSGLLSEDPVAHSAATRPDQTACIEIATGNSLTYAELDGRVARCAGLLAAVIGEPAQARVAVIARNSIDQIVLAFACQRAGAIFVPLNWRLAAAELAVLVTDCTPALLVFGEEFGAAALQAAGSAPGLQTMPFEGEAGLSARIARAAAATAVPAMADDPSIILYTSGTTGRPKGVIVTRGNAFFAALDFMFLGEVGPRTVAYSDLPLFHTIGLIAICRTTLTMGGTLVISDRFLAERTLSALSNPALGITHYFAVPQIAAALRNDPSYRRADLTRLTAIFVGGAPLTPDLIEAFLADDVKLINGYGMSEAGSVLHVPLDLGAIRASLGSVGLPAPLLELRIVAADGRDVVDDAVGELWLSGPAVSPGYWNKPAETAAAFTDGWYHTGDLVRRDRNGFFRVVDRLKDMFISGGENVYPAEIEAVLLAHPDVLEAAVIGVPDPRWGEAGVAFVVARPGSALAEAELAAHCESRLARYKRPRQFARVETIARTASGKALKQELREAYRARGSDR